MRNFVYTLAMLLLLCITVLILAPMLFKMLVIGVILVIGLLVLFAE